MLTAFYYTIKNKFYIIIICLNIDEPITIIDEWKEIKDKRIMIIAKGSSD